jgi:hypothetical protein
MRRIFALFLIVLCSVVLQAEPQKGGRASSSPSSSRSTSSSRSSVEHQGYRLRDRAPPFDPENTRH